MHVCIHSVLHKQNWNTSLFNIHTCFPIKSLYCMFSHSSFYCSDPPTARKYFSTFITFLSSKQCLRSWFCWHSIGAGEPHALWVTAQHLATRVAVWSGIRCLRHPVYMCLKSHAGKKNKTKQKPLCNALHYSVQEEGKLKPYNSFFFLFFLLLQIKVVNN